MKKIFYIFLFVVGVNFGTFAQSGISLSSNQSTRFIKFYPNPAASFINFEFQKGYDKLFSFQVYNFIGRKIVDIKSVTPKINISLADFYRGVYIYQLRNNSGKIIESGKFQVVK